MFFEIVVIFSVILIFCYVFIELHYFLHLGLILIQARFFKKRVDILQETTVTGICLTTDVDTFLYHMNNARFMREIDFARADFYERTGLYRCIKLKCGGIAMGAQTIRYRRFIKLFRRYIISTKIVYWDAQNIYMEHRFITPSDNFVNAIVLTKTRLINCSAEDVMNELLACQTMEENVNEHRTQLKPEMPLDIAKWIEYNEISSGILRNAG